MTYEDLQVVLPFAEFALGELVLRTENTTRIMVSSAVQIGYCYLIYLRRQFSAPRTQEQPRGAKSSDEHDCNGYRGTRY
jgi:hypothetical protein